MVDNSGNLPVLDEAMLVELKDIMEDDFGLLLETFLADATVRMGVIDVAAAEQQSDVLREAAHSFKGSCANIGAMRLSNLASNLEQKAKNNELQSVELLVASIHTAYDEVRILIKAELAAC
jgi:HPt (histidine-containing phosphotransfer) domain-containing protein